MKSINLEITKTNTPKELPDINNLGFGKFFTDHMFMMDYTEEKGWNNKRIVPYQPLSLDPSAMVLHYAQSVFEGMKAYKHNNKIFLFRPNKNFERLNVSNARMSIPSFDANEVMVALKELIRLDEKWIPTKEGTSLYIRPFIFATDSHLGARTSQTYSFIIICSPVGSYYAEGINPVKIQVENNYVRAVRGGVGFAKTAGNYAASLLALTEANTKGCAQVLWLDAIEKKYIEEVGTMNVFFVIGDEVITPPLEGSILPGITRDSIITLLRHWGYNVVERKLSIDEVFKASNDKTLKEAFGTGTAAVISPIGELLYGEKTTVINNYKTGAISEKLYNQLTSIQFGKVPDPFDWVVEI